MNKIVPGSMGVEMEIALDRSKRSTRQSMYVRWKVDGVRADLLYLNSCPNDHLKPVLKSILYPTDRLSISSECHDIRQDGNDSTPNL